MVNDLQSYLTNLPNKPGVYQMYDKQHEVIYVGKAKNLKKRVNSYFHGPKDAKTTNLVNCVVAIEVIITASENEAFLLENSLIKKYKPKYNIIFKDDKSYPYLYLSSHEYPRLSLYRGAKNSSGNYFGPYSNSAAARQTLHFLQKTFKLRQCNDLYFRNRSRPCVLYQIKRCSAPCVQYITAEAYQRNVDLVKQFLAGRSREVLKLLKQDMQQAATELDYELAAKLRDQITQLEQVTEQQFVVGKVGEVDAVAIVAYEAQVAICILFIRGGRVTGSRPYIISANEANLTEILSAFISQHYLSEPHNQVIPQQILVNLALSDKQGLSATLTEMAGHKVVIKDAVRGVNSEWLKMATTNAQHALNVRQAKQADVAQAFAELQLQLDLTSVPATVECFDISHTMGEATVASCVVFNQQGPDKANYRRFNIKGVTKSDDYAAIKQALERRYAKHKLPDLVMIDGGKGQLNIAKQVLGEGVVIVAIAKGPSRKPGLEVLFSTTKSEAFTLPADSAALHLLQRVRDEAHRFAITGHRQRRQKATISSVLDAIHGIGKKRRQELLAHFGGFREIKAATVEELSQVKGIDKKIAQQIHAALQKLEL